MTREEAARILDPETSLGAFVEYNYYGGFKGEDRWMEAVNEACKMGAEAIRELDAQEKKPMCKWISVKDRLPEEEGSYIVATKNGGVGITHYYDRHNRFSTHLNKLITHWMERPQPQKEEHHAE